MNVLRPLFLISGPSAFFQTWKAFLDCISLTVSSSFVTVTSRAKTVLKGINAPCTVSAVFGVKHSAAQLSVISSCQSPYVVLKVGLGVPVTSFVRNFTKMSFSIFHCKFSSCLLFWITTSKSNKICFTS